MVESTQYYYSTLYQIKNWVEIPHDIDLFNMLFVFENYPELRFYQYRKNNEVHVEDIRSYEKSHFPLAIIVEPGNTINVEISYEYE